MNRFVLLLLLLAATACTTTYDYDPVTVGDVEGGARVPRSKTSSQFVRDVFGSRPRPRPTPGTSR